MGFPSRPLPRTSCLFPGLPEQPAANSSVFFVTGDSCLLGTGKAQGVGLQRKCRPAPVWDLPPPAQEEPRLSKPQSCGRDCPGKHAHARSSFPYKKVPPLGSVLIIYVFLENCPSHLQFQIHRHRVTIRFTL